MGSWVPEAWTVRRRVRETADTVTLTLEPSDADRRGVARPIPGQFNMLYAHGIGEIPVSVSGAARDGRALLHTIRGVGAVSRALCALKRGDGIGLRGPFGSSWPTPALEGMDVLIVAGGLGLAPLRPAIAAIAANRGAYGDVSLLYGGRSPEGLLFAGARREWITTNNINALEIVDHTTTTWAGRIGVVTSLLPARLRDPSRTGALLCGPELMMRFAATDLVHLGIPAERIHLSMERNMKCAIGLCGRCQFNRHFVCKDGPVFTLAQVQDLLPIREL